MSIQAPEPSLQQKETFSDYLFVTIGLLNRISSGTVTEIGAMAEAEVIRSHLDALRDDIEENRPPPEPPVFLTHMGF